MSKEAVQLFMGKIDQNEELQKLIIDALETQNSTLNLVDEGREHGFEFTEAEFREVWSEVLEREELSDFALELISGGWASSQPSAPADDLGPVDSRPNK